MRRFIALGLLALGLPALAAEVIDLGKLNVEGAARGPEIQFIRPLRPDEEALGRLLLSQMKELEESLLKPAPPSEKTETRGESR